ncbi:hypothetical protein Q5Y75_16440 [Ruegeria sp. 2205SS24-7]|uniref:hypothetical protein n=1 Tax=Ruegeria discodermiae TaxID=3064389 RepID=UPI0027419204|nr:hypothetical protein [Ruegeria sp. 2205SS24-7]MDP5218820.1 hypothetical protein [Ruegeria sp. 2205SS24-7]
MTRLVTALLTAMAILNLPHALAAQSSQENFETMVQPSGDLSECKAPKPPKDLDSFAYVRNGFREIMRIEAYASAIEAKSCDCPFAEIDWHQIVEISEKFVTSDNPKLPFDVIDLRSRADQLEINFAAICEG